ncbi:PAAR domain-containing protein [Vulcaniibacterium tengchongense]|uniref:Putative Zn-binding protein involved in type VI secretion n=1 Tax=Vulcaniibacterium tengchongense TaxID=1273429 RepID=A0A3N4V113_9GAMM|nr:PAAR domain-containing protein [Vulcaniibacterium tengchongense]RPE75863.1 putative Zn-binding protein involved in type VI secretion [Vulcaniibacterium tengchongense]
MSKPFIVVGDKTDHGGTVLTGSPETDLYSKPVARVGDPVQCPKCQGTFPIASGDASLIIDGRPVARHGDKTACGATLIAGQSQAFVG